jgi:phage terminase small subunit
MLREIARVAYADPRRLFRADGTLVPIVELDEDAAGMIAAIEVDEDGRTTRVRMWDKNQALEKALKYLGLYERDNAQHSENLELQVLLVGKP